MIYYNVFIDLFMAVTSIWKVGYTIKNRIRAAILWAKTNESDFQYLTIDASHMSSDLVMTLYR